MPTKEADWWLWRAEDILRKATAPRRTDGTYNYSREAFEQMANDYFADKEAEGEADSSGQ